MWANRIVEVASALVAIVWIPVVWVSTLLLGVASSVFGVWVLLPFSLIWLIVFVTPMLAMSWLWQKAPLLRLPLALIGIPLAVVAGLYSSMIPEHGDQEARSAKLRLCWSWPFSLSVMRWDRGERMSLDEEDRVLDVLARLPKVVRAVPLVLLLLAGCGSPFEDRDCDSFRTHREAQAFYEAEGGPEHDRHTLDADQDGVACEALQ